MTDFDVLVDKILLENADYVPLRTVVEKEVLHYEILRVMAESDFLGNLTFMGGTCLRDCYGSVRLSEDLDFTGGFEFSKADLADFGEEIHKAIKEKYGFDVSVSEPKKEEGNTDTWKIKVVTKPEQKNLPSRKINIDICHLPSRDRKVQFLRNFYGLDFGTSDMPIFAESLEEIFCDKVIAFARRPNRIKMRDLWDIHWLYKKNVLLDRALLLQKLDDRKIQFEQFKALYDGRIKEVENLQKDFLFEMQRFLMPSAFTKRFTSSLWWQALVNLLAELGRF